ncbi:FMN-binding protein [Peptoniphilus sp.]|jgi:major membrane immunogen (membrane-anchored lipoprotein)|uniref:FMN-binding protein n=1 Tax=Peptoniphilus sp. TaxID=1971214 RepID=UPI003D8CF72A
MNKKLINIALASVLSLSLIGCGASNDKKVDNAKTNNTAAEEMANNAAKAEAEGLKDGTYTGKSSEDKYGGTVEVTVTVADGKISKTEVKNLNADGSEKDETYGEEAGDEGHKVAQDTLKASQEYGKELTEKGSVEEVEAISGATQSYDQFVEAANSALEQAK